MEEQLLKTLLELVSSGPGILVGIVLLVLILYLTSKIGLPILDLFDRFRKPKSNEGNDVSLNNATQTARVQAEIIQSLIAVSKEEDGSSDIQVDELTEEAIARTISQLVNAGEGARKRACEKLTATPPDPEGALVELKQLAAQQEESVSDAAETYREIGAIAFFTNTQDALEAYKRVTELKPDDADAHNMLGHLYHRTGDLNRAKAAFEKVLSLSNQSADQMMIAAAYGGLGNVDEIKGNLNEAKDYQQKALAAYVELNHDVGMSKVYSNLGLLEYMKGNFDAAEAYIQRGLEIDIELGREEGMAAKYSNLGLIEEKRGDIDEAEAHHERALDIQTRLDRKVGMAVCYGNLGNVELARDNLPAAKAHYKNALELGEELEDFERIAVQLGNLALIEHKEANFEVAEMQLKKALELNKQLGRTVGVALQYSNLGDLEKEQGDIRAAIAYWRKSHALYAEIGIPDMEEQIAGWLREAGAPVDGDAA